MELSVTFSMLLAIIDRGLVIWIPCLLVFGCILKHATPFPNQFLPIAEFCSAFCVASVYGMGVTGAGSIGAKFVDVFVVYGLGQGLLLTMSTVLIYDAVHGIFKYIEEKRRKEKEEKDEETL